MNSTSSVNETNLVNFSADLSTLNQLDTKDSLLSFPFDHIYACHSKSSDRRQTLQLDKEVEISAHCVVTEEKGLVVSTSTDISRLTARLASLENQNQKLKGLLIYHLDLIQQQNELITKREKLYQALKQENVILKSKVSRTERRVTLNQRRIVNPSPIVHVPSSSVTSTAFKSEPGSSSQIMLNSFTELLLPDNRPNSFIFNSDLSKTKSFDQDTFDLTRTSETDVTSYLSSDLGVSTILDSNINCDDFNMIENRRSFLKKDMKTENRSDVLYTVTSNSDPVIQRIQKSRRRNTSLLGCLNRMSKSPSTNVELPASSKAFEEEKSGYERFSVNKKCKMINTYGKSRTSINTKKTSQLTGSLADRLQLIDTTPTGEDPYQLGEADMREQSPIPKLMLQKANHGRMKICTETSAVRSTIKKRIYNSVSETNTKLPSKIKLTNQYNLTNPYMHPSEIKPDSPKTLIVNEPDLDIVKTETEIDWRMYNPNKPGNETSMCDFSYGEIPSNLATKILPSLDSVEFQDLLSPHATMHLDALNTEQYNASSEPSFSDKMKKRVARTTSLTGSNFVAVKSADSKRGTDGKRRRKRALSTTGLLKTLKRENFQKGVRSKPKLIKTKGETKVPWRGKKSTLPGMVTNKHYQTLVGDPDLSWYLGLDPDVKLEDVDQAGDTKVSTVEVPRWREKPYTSCYTLEGTENLDDRIFEKRHQKLEAEERRQLRWHMRRIREQRHVERLRQRQRDSWCSGSTSPAQTQPSVFTVWPQPQRDLCFIEITDVLPVTAFGEILPALPESDFVLPWVKTSKAMKRSKRSKTLH